MNISARQIVAPGLPEMVAGLFDRFRMDPAALTLEMTESIFLDDNARVLSALGQLKALGAQLALDDFGTGYSSLGYLRKYPVDIVKIDQGFVGDIGVEAFRGAIVAAVTNLAHVLGMQVIAEGVETDRQREEVVRIGCEAAQGYFYARPMNADDISRHLHAQPSALRLPAGT